MTHRSEHLNEPGHQTKSNPDEIDEVNFHAQILSGRKPDQWSSSEKQPRWQIGEAA